MFNLGGSKRARLVASFIAALSAFGLGYLINLSDGFEEIHERRAVELPPIEPDSRVQVVVFDPEFFKRNPGPLTVEQVAEVAKELSEAGAAVVAFHLPIARNLTDPGLADAVKDLNYVDLAEGEVFKVGGDWRFDAAEGETTGRHSSGVGIIPTENAYWQTSVPLTFVTRERSWVPALATAAVREYSRVTGTADPTLAHGVDADYGRQWPQPSTRFRWQDRNYGLSEETSADPLGLISVDRIASQRARLDGAIVFVAEVNSNRTLPTEGPFEPIGQSYSYGAGPNGGYYTSIALQSNVAAMLLAPPFHETNWPEVLGWSLGLALAVSLAAMFLRTVIAALVAFAMMAAWWMVVVYRRFVNDGNFEFEVPAIVAGISLLIAFGLRARLTRKQAEKLSVLAEYVPPAVVMAMAAKSNGKGPEPEVATVLYADVRGFTTLTGELDPSRIRTALDLYYGVLGAVVAAHRGTLLYYAGDGMVVTFGATGSPDHAERAVACAVAMQEARSQLTDLLGKEDLPPMEFGVGIHTGEVIIGPIGSRHHRQFTALGEAVNLSARMCAVAEGGQICLTEQTREMLAAPPPMVDMGELQLKNVMRGIQGWRISEAAAVPTPVA